MASSLSQRDTAVSPMEATNPRSIAFRLLSATLQRERGTPLSSGKSHASALMAIATLGGKPGWVPAAWLLFQPAESFFKEPFTPFADDLPRGIQPGSDFVVIETPARVQDDLGSGGISY